MPLSLPEEVLAVLTEGRPERLIGTPETPRIGFRACPFALGTEAGSWELAWAVADLANSSGGVIVVGVRTAVSGGSDVAAALTPHPAALLDADRYQRVISTRVRPAVECEFSYVPAPHQAGRGYLCIQVKPLGAPGPRAKACHPGPRYRPLRGAYQVRSGS
jgi:hypothetical protein